MQPEDLAGALEGVRVVEWGSFVSAPFCGKVLAELGADVIKIEKKHLYGLETTSTRNRRDAIYQYLLDAFKEED